MKKIIPIISIILCSCTTCPTPKIDNSNSENLITHYVVRENKIDEHAKKIEVVENEAWRYGNTHFKSVKHLTDDTSILTIYNSPDIYTINMNNMNALHATDQDQPSVIKVPVLDDDKISLEFGEEFDFFSSHNATKSNEVIGFISYDKYHLSLEGYDLNLYTKENEKLPIYLTYSKDYQKEILSYQTYEKIPYSTIFFHIPKNLNVIEVPDSEINLN